MFVTIKNNIPFTLIFYVLLCIASVYINTYLAFKFAGVSSGEYFFEISPPGGQSAQAAESPAFGVWAVTELHKMEGKTSLILLVIMLTLLLSSGMLYVIRDWIATKNNTT